MACRPQRERKRVYSFLQETLDAERKVTEAKRRKKEAEEAKKKELDEAEGSILAEFERAKQIEEALQKEEALVHESRMREARYRIKKDMLRSTEMQNQFLADRLEFIESFLPQKVAKTLKKLRKIDAPCGDLAVVPHVAATPSFIEATMRDYQLTGLNWLLTLFDNGANGILADEMGLGKTLQTIAFIGYLVKVRDVCGPYLVVCPLSVLGNWLTECKKWCPFLRVVQLYGPTAERNAQRESLLREHFDVCVTTYEMVVAEEKVLGAKLFRYVILDEAQRIKSHSSKTALAIRHVPCQHRLLLTGTPLQNNVHELWALLNFLFPNAFTSSDAFDQCFDLDRNIVDVQMLQRVHGLLKPIMLRRVKTDVELELPPKIETKILVPLTPLQKQWYKSLVTREVGDGGLENLSKVSWAKFVYLLMQLRKCCNHPYMFPEAYPDPYVPGNDIIEHSGKMRVLDKLLLRLRGRGSKVLLFSGFTTMLDVLEDYCEFRQYRYLRLDGSRSRIHREVDIKGFQNPNSEYFIFLISTRAGGLGLNLPAADTVVLYDSDWNPQVDIQAQARSHRIGQTKTVRVFRLVTQGSAEQRIVQRAEKKLFLDAVVHYDEKSMNGALEPNELLETIRFGCENIFNSVDQEVTEEDIEGIVSCSLDGQGQVEDPEEEVVSGSSTAPRQRLDGSAKHKASDFNAEEEFVSITNLDGVDLKRNRSSSSAGADLVEVTDQKRTRQPRMVTVSSRFSSFIVKTLVKREDLPIMAPAPTNGKVKPTPKTKKERPTESECWVCHDGGELLCCSYCPKVYHPECLRHNCDDTKGMWSCPQHQCIVCDKSASEAGGVLFRCSTCPLCFCYAHHPPDSDILHEGCPMMNEMGYQPSSAVFIKCPSCLQFAATGKRLLDIDVWARRLEPDYDDEEVEAVLDKKFNCHRSSKTYGVNYQLKWRHYGPKHISWRTRQKIDPKYHHLLDTFDREWATKLEIKERRAKELRDARLSRPSAPWDPSTKADKVARQVAKQSQSKQKQAEAQQGDTLEE